MPDIFGPAPGENNFFDNMKAQMLTQLLNELWAPQAMPRFNDNASIDEQKRMQQEMLNNMRAAGVGAPAIGPYDAFRVPDANTFSPDDVSRDLFYQQLNQENI